MIWEKSSFTSCLLLSSRIASKPGGALGPLSRRYPGLQDGFWAAVPRERIAAAAATAADLRLMVCGAAADDDASVDIQATFRVVQDEEFVSAGDGALAEAFWGVVKGWPKDRRRMLVKFVTGSERCAPMEGAA